MARAPYRAICFLRMSVCKLSERQSAFAEGNWLAIRQMAHGSAAPSGEVAPKASKNRMGAGRKKKKKKAAAAKKKLKKPAPAL